MTRRIAMWSGPRNISTAMMRAWGSRSDTIVCDEPFYAYYLKHTGYTHHPAFEEILADQEANWEKIVAELTSELPDGKSIYYQKHMAHHIVGNFAHDWTDDFTNVFLIRDPREMLLSLTKLFPDPSIEETGLPQQVELFDRVRRTTGSTPPVLDAKNVLDDPEGILRALCDEIDVPFRAEMLRWERGIRDTDGIWAKYWYANVAESESFAAYTPRTGDLPARHDGLLQECQGLYDYLSTQKLNASGN